MSLPSNANLGFAAGQFIDGTGAAAAGKKVTFTPSVKTLLDAGATPNPVTILPKKITVTLDENGYVPTTAEATAASKKGQHLLATTDPDLNPTGWTWKVDFAFAPDFERSSFSFSLDVGEQIDLTTKAPTSAAGGAVIVQGIPTGGADGQILAKDSATDYDTVWINPPSPGGTGLPGGGTAGQALVKQSGTAGDATWQNLAPGNIAGLAEAIDDRVAGLLVAGANVSLIYDDASGTLTIAASGGGGGAVLSVNTLTGDVVLDAASVGALPDDYVPDWDDISKPAAIAAGATAALARAAIGAGTSSLAIGTAGTDAMAGNKTAADLGGIVSDATGIPGASVEEFANFVSISATDYAALDDPETNYPDTFFWVV